MDRQISSDQIKSQNRSKWLKIIAAIAVVALAIWGARHFLTRKASKSEFHIARVERGDLQNTLTASGLVVPSYEREINAPVTTEIKKVHRRSGDVVEQGNIILDLDAEFTQLSYDQLYDELQLKRNNVDKLKLEYDKNLTDLGYQDQIKGLQLDELRAEVTDQKRLNEVGGATAEEVEQAILNLKIAELEKKMLENELQYRKSVNANEKQGLELEYAIQQKKLKEFSRKLRETQVKAPQSGVITWVNEDIGRKVSEGEPLVRIANLNSFTIESTTSDRNAGKLNIGQAVNVRINRQDFPGRITAILPEVVNNTIKFLVELDEQDNELLRPNLRAEVYIITDNKENVLRIKNGSAFRGAQSQDIFVVEGGKAVKRRITKGISNSDYVEIVNNLAEGEQVIISATEDFDHLDEFIIQE